MARAVNMAAVKAANGAKNPMAKVDTGVAKVVMEAAARVDTAKVATAAAVRVDMAKVDTVAEAKVDTVKVDTEAVAKAAMAKVVMEAAAKAAMAKAANIRAIPQANMDSPADGARAGKAVTKANMEANREVNSDAKAVMADMGPGGRNPITANMVRADMANPAATWDKAEVSRAMANLGKTMAPRGRVPASQAKITTRTFTAGATSS